MDLQEVSKLILLQVQHNDECGKDEKFTLEEIEDIIKRRVVDALRPEKTYEIGKYYDGLGYFIGIVDEYPYDKDYCVKVLHFRIPIKGRENASEINKVSIIQIKK